MKNRKWNKGLIISIIRKFYRERKYLNARYIKRKYHKLYGAACYHFPCSWQKAVEAAGFDYNKDIRKDIGWDKQKIIQEIKRRHRKHQRLNPYLNKKLLVPAVRCFGSYEDAIKVAGFSYKKLGIRSSRKLGEKEIREQLLKLDKKGKPLNAGYLAKYHSRLYRSAIDCFGSHQKAIEAIGLDYGKVRRLRNLQAWVKSLTSEDMEELEKQILSLK